MTVIYQTIIEQFPKAPGDAIRKERLACGHIIGTDTYYKAKKRRCWKCEKGVPVDTQSNHL